MIFSKSFGYALRGVLYVAMSDEGKTKVHLGEIAEELSVPRHFLGKVMNKLVKEGVISSLKGPYGGFYINEKTMGTPLQKLIEITGETEEFTSCVLRLGKCDSSKPCAVHHQVESLRRQWENLLVSTTIGHLMKSNQPGIIRSIPAL